MCVCVCVCVCARVCVCVCMFEVTRDMCTWWYGPTYRYEKRQVLKARFEIEQKLRRARRVKKRKAKEVREKEQLRMVRKSRRSRQEDVSKSKAMDELKAKRSAGMGMKLEGRDG